MTQKKTLLLALAGILSMLFAGSVQAERSVTDCIDIVDGTFTCGGQISDFESGGKIFDGRTDTKWLDNSVAWNDAETEHLSWVILDFKDDESYVLDNYTITYANDDKSRAPKDWTVEGSNDGESWTVISTVTGEAGWELFQERPFGTVDPNDAEATNSEAYKMYKLAITANNGSANLMQISEFGLFDSEGTKLPAMAGILSARNQIHDGEGFMNAIDNTDAKWLSNNPAGDYNSWLRYQFINQPYAINGYSIASCGDAHDRDPHTIVLKASNDGENWVELDSREGESWSEWYQRREFEFDNSTPYYYYQVDLTSNSTLTGLSEFELLSIIDSPQITSVTPVNYSTTALDPVVLSWETVRASAAATYNVTVKAGSTTIFEATGLTEKTVEIPAASIIDDTVYTWTVDIVDNVETGTTVFPGDSNQFRVLRHSEEVLAWNMDAFGSSTVYSYEMPVTGVTVKASSIEGDNRAAGQTLGVGFSIDPSIADPNGLKHTYWPWDSWISHPDQEGTTWIQYDFEEETSIGDMLIWNHNCAKEYYDSENNRGMKNVVIGYTLEENDDPNWIPVGDFLIPIGTGIDGVGPSLIVPFDGIVAKAVRISAAEEDSNWGAAGNMHALAEVRFGKYNEFMVSHSMTDGSGNGNNAATYNSPELVGGPNDADNDATKSISGSALDLKITGSLFLARNNPSVETLPLGLDDNCNSSWSMNFFTLLPEQAADLSFFVGFGDYAEGTGRYIAKFADGIHFWGGDNTDGVSNVPFDLNRWQMITATYADNTLKMYKNGEEIYSGTVELGLASPTVTVGGDTPWNLANLDGIIDEFTMYRGALSQTEIDALLEAMPSQYDAINPIPATGTVAVATDPILSWEAPLDAYDPTYTVYIGTDAENMTAVATGLVDPTFDLGELAEPLAFGTTYSWMVDTASGTESDTWTFTTVGPESAAVEALVWDFEETGVLNMNYEVGIEDITATASSFEQPSTWREPWKAVNGYGLTVDPLEANPALAFSHSNQATMGWCSVGESDPKPWIQFEFDETYPIGTVLIWNHNVDPTWSSEVDRGMRNVVIKYSPNVEDGSEPNSWVKLGDYELAVGLSVDAETPIPYGTAIDFNGKNARSVRIEAADTNSNWGATNNMHGLAYVRFGIDGTTAQAQTVADATANGNDGAGYAEFVDGLGSGTAAKLAGANTFLDCTPTNAEALPLAATDQWSINMYINSQEIPGGASLFGGFGGSAVGTGRFVGDFNGVHFWGGDNTDLGAPVRQLFAQWQMVTVTYTGSNMYMYLNGQPIAAAYGLTLEDAAEFVTLNGMNGWGYNFNGLVDDYTIYTGVLTRAEMATLAERVPAVGDFDMNGVINTVDLAELAGEWLVDVTTPVVADLNDDSSVDLLDVAILAESWMQN